MTELGQPQIFETEVYFVESCAPFSLTLHLYSDEVVHQEEKEDEKRSGYCINSDPVPIPIEVIISGTETCENHGNSRRSQEKADQGISHKDSVRNHDEVA